MKTFLGILSVFTLICFQTTTTATDKPAETTPEALTAKTETEKVENCCL